MKTNILILIAFFSMTCAFGQTVKDVLDSGIPVAKPENVFLSVDTGKMSYDVGKDPGTPHKMEKDTLLFLAKAESVNVYLAPLNPLNYSYGSKNEIIVDRISEDEKKALQSITDNFKSIGNNLKTADKAFRETYYDDEEEPLCKTDELIKDYNNIKAKLDDNKQKKIVEIFKALKALTFNNKEETEAGVKEAKREIDSLESYYTRINDLIDNFRKKINKTAHCSDATLDFLVKQQFNDLADDLADVRALQYKRVKNLVNAFSLVEKEQKKASIGKNGKTWVVWLDDVPAARGKISAFTVTIFKSGYRLSDATDTGMATDEIIADTQSVHIKRTMLFRRFQRFVPEIMAGTAYTNLDFPKYGLTTDAAGNNVIADTGTENIKRFNITAMLNYNYYIQDSEILPFIQLGVGANADFPTFFLGTGLRISGTLTLSVGFAGSWIKQLDKHKIGDVIEDDAALQEDLKYQFAEPKLYYGLQYNF